MEIGTWMLLLGSIAGEGARRTLEKNGCRLNEPPSMVFSALVKKTSMLQTWFRSSRELLDLKGPCGQRRVSAMGFILFHLLDALALQKIPKLWTIPGKLGASSKNKQGEISTHLVEGWR